jgi:hypothetical protein
MSELDRLPEKQLGRQLQLILPCGCVAISD